MFELTQQTVHFANFNARTELNGETRKPASDISCRAQLPNKILNSFFPGLLEMLYERPKNPDLAEQADPDAATSLRLPLLGLPLDWDLVLDNRTLTIDYGLGDEKSNIVLPECKVHKFKITPQNGGTVLVAWQISAHPDAKQAGRLAVRPPADRHRHHARGGQAARRPGFTVAGQESQKAHEGRGAGRGPGAT